MTYERILGLPMQPPTVGVLVERRIMCRRDLRLAPWMLHDHVRMDGMNTGHDFEMGVLVTTQAQAESWPVRTEAVYRFPYARSTRAGLRYPWARVPIIDGRTV